MQKQRIWELDALRGLCILCVIVVHFLFDLQYFIGLELTLPGWFLFVQQYGGVIFVILSGCCATLGTRSFRSGVIVFGAGMLISLVTAGMYGLGLADRTVIVWFGVLHLLGLSMMLYPVLKKLPSVPMAVLALVIILTGYAITGTVVETHLLFPFGLVYHGFYSSDYFPIFPQLGWFLLGVVLGRTVYAGKQTLLPGRAQDFFLLRFLRWCGRQSLFIYLLHQPLLYGVLELLAALTRR